MKGKNVRFLAFRMAAICAAMLFAVVPVNAQESVDADQARNAMHTIKELVLDKNSQISQEERNLYNACLAVMLRQMEPNPQMEDSLLNAAWHGEMSLPQQQRRSQIFQYIAIGRMLRGEKNDVTKNIDIVEKYNRLAPDFNSSEYLEYRQFLLSARTFADDMNNARRQVVEDLVILNDKASENVASSKGLLTYLSVCNKVIDRKDVNLMLAYLVAVNKHYNQYIKHVGADKFEPAFMVNLMEILSVPAFEKYVTAAQIETMYEQFTDILNGRKLTETETISFCNLLNGKASFYIAHDNLAEAEKAVLKMRDVSSDLKGVMAANMRMKQNMLLMQICMKNRDLDKLADYYPEFRESVASSTYDNGEFQSLLLKMETMFLARKGDMTGMVDSAIKSYELSRSEIEHKFPFMTAIDREHYLSGFGDPAHVLTESVRINPEKLAAPTYDAILYRTGLQFRAQKRIDDMLAKSKNHEAKLLNDSIAMLREAYATSDYNLSAIETDVKLRNLEYRLIDMLQKESGRSYQPDTWQDIRKCLKKGEAAVEMFFANNKYTMALVVKHDSRIPELVAVGDAEELVKCIYGGSPVSSPLQLARKIYDNADTRLYELVWQPMEKILADVDKVYLSAGGLLSTVSFNAIAMPGGGYLFDRYDIRQLTTTAELLRPARRRQPRKSVVMGDVDFSGKGAATSGGVKPLENELSEERDVVAVDDFSERGVSRTHFRRLPFTVDEMEAIRRLLPEKNTMLLSGSEASEQNLRLAAADTPDLLHLATHGFFLPDTQTALKVPYMSQHRNLAASSMQRSGLALAGAEAAWRGQAAEDDNDGILTALEVAQMDLSGVQLVTLSACETALGNYNFEGVYGLPRGFKQAGAGSMLVSLWSVSDKATSLFMTEFYTQWLAGKDIHEAYRHATASVRAQYPAPSLWAPFLLLD